ncbi:hypothetical protein GOB57_21170 [Sinorhizobium meliloti]|nr:hypothetical protein [Sinorhizobium meliloti]
MNASPSLASKYARARYEAILAAGGQRRNELLAAAFESAVNMVVASLPEGIAPVSWVSDPSFFAPLDVSCLENGWAFLGAVRFAGEHDGGFIWAVASAPAGTSLGQWLAFYEFGYRLDNRGYAAEWVPAGMGRRFQYVRPEQSGPDVLAELLVQKLAHTWVARDLRSSGDVGNIR